MEKITKREMYTRIASLLASEADVVAFCEKEIDALDRKAAKAKETAAKKRAEGDELTEAVFEALTPDFETIDAILNRIEGEDVTKGKVQYRLNALFKDGRIAKGEVTIPGGEGSKSRKVVAYALPQD